ncbi:hypothetical protein E2C01_066678 [Portunus trituberculatus]|uniref:Uncharacterized protein n=1 Tax=Portunus trituberculatus TaxID=210409 RepID=A0A5B7HVB5_PORTR|nr:hypothetical protein [Portunus trituberculatus]
MLMKQQQRRGEDSFACFNSIAACRPEIASRHTTPLHSPLHSTTAAAYHSPLTTPYLHHHNHFCHSTTTSTTTIRGTSNTILPQ